MCEALDFAQPARPSWAWHYRLKALRYKKPINREAGAVAAVEPALAAWMHEAVVDQSEPGSALAQLIAVAVSASRDEKNLNRRIAEEQGLSRRSLLIEITTLDLRAPIDRDPACPGPLPCCCVPGSWIALQAYRIWRHCLGTAARPSSPASYTAASPSALHVSIHPSVTIGSGLFIDHGTGITIGEGVVIGQDVSMLQDVTLGSLPEGQAGAPRISNNVLLSAGATVLGDVNIGDFAKIGAGSLVLASVHILVRRGRRAGRGS